MAALSQQIPLLASAEMVEVLAACRAFQFAHELSFDRLVLEGDSETIINSIVGDNMESFSFGHILQDIKSMLFSLNNVFIGHVRRQGTCVAHRLARRTINNSYYDIIDVQNHDLIMIE